MGICTLAPPTNTYVTELEEHHVYFQFTLVFTSYVNSINIFTCIHNEKQYLLFIFNLLTHTCIIHLKLHYSIPQLYNLYFVNIFTYIENKEQYVKFIFNLLTQTCIIHLKQHYSIPQLYNFILICAKYTYT